MNRKWLYIAIGSVVAMATAAGIYVMSQGRGNMTMTNGGDGGSRQAPTDKNMVIMKQSAFTPSTITVAKGTTVTWRNDDSYIHRIAADDGSFDLGDQLAGSSVTYTFVQSGAYPYHCTVHPFMKGVVIVE